MTAALIAVLLILLGLPLLAWWIGGRPVWSRLKPGRGPDPHGDFVRRHRLTPAEQTQVFAAVTRGRALDDERLRAATVDLAGETLKQVGAFGRGGTRAQRIVSLLLVLWFVALVVDVVAALVSAGPSDFPWFGLMAVVGVVAIPLVQRRAARRAIRLNGEPEPEAGA